MPHYARSVGSVWLVCWSLGGCKPAEEEASAATSAGESSEGATSAAASTSEGGSAGESSTTDAPAEPGPDAMVTLFQGEHIYFGAENHRQADVTVTLPEPGFFYKNVTLNLALGCPNGLCDHWDRYGSIGVVRWPGAEDEGLVEVARFITAYRLPGQWAIDVTDLQPLLAGELTFRVFIDTWVGPGHAQGDGWLVDARLDFEGGVPSPLPIAALPLWQQSFGAGDPGAPISAQVPVMTVTPPAEATSFRLRTAITGHGFGNTDNCAEFCAKNHGFMINDVDPYSTLVWRDDCPETAVQDQFGTWQYPRAGWCPGADVIPWEVDVTPSIAAGAPNSVMYALQSYENTCRPGLDVCKGCTAGMSCEDGHGQPYYYLSSVLIALKEP